jgi:hypothetical protein
VPFELEFEMTAKSELANDISLVELKCFRSAS